MRYGMDTDFHFAEFGENAICGWRPGASNKTTADLDLVDCPECLKKAEDEAGEEIREILNRLDGGGASWSEVREATEYLRTGALPAHADAPHLLDCLRHRLKAEGVTS